MTFDPVADWEYNETDITKISNLKPDMSDGRHIGKHIFGFTKILADLRGIF